MNLDPNDPEIQILLSMRGEISTLAVKVDGLQTAINMLKAEKINRSELSAVTKLNWILKNWKLVITFIVVASSLGLITVQHEALKKIIALLTAGGL